MKNVCLNRRASAAAFLALFLVLTFLLPACQRAKKTVLPVRDEVLIFHKAMDYTYLRVIDAVLNTPDWSLYETDKREGIIRAYNLKYADPFGPLDNRVATFKLKRLSRTRTAVELDPASQTVLGAKDLLKEIKDHMNR